MYRKSGVVEELECIDTDESGEVLDEIAELSVPTFAALEESEVPNPVEESDGDSGEEVEEVEVEEEIEA